ncbi:MULTISPECIES: hypothetical protein [Deinococcus]|uniref:Protein NO VEIN C-terminal domain-containing protein n=1 Tax=Deinococcus rufus TaxID=2136097 RepID=A0ABV7Z6K9_9DEIO|nr:hypothetical protein [Deinococcus sp. AB2017081]WQE94417.1 hypothetical protein U2P90_13510 [Deinococcus sp. AB2017081]
MIKDDYNNFRKLLKEGEAGEDTVTQWFINRGNTVIDSARDKGNFKDWDLKIETPHGKELTIEIKTDKSISNNLAIEFSSRGKDSGIVSTKADVYLIYFVNDSTLYAMRSDDLREWIKDNSPRVVKNKQNDSDTYLYLIPKDVFTSYEVQ